MKCRSNSMNFDQDFRHFLLDATSSLLVPNCMGTGLPPLSGVGLYAQDDVCRNAEHTSNPFRQGRRAWERMKSETPLPLVLVSRSARFNASVTAGFPVRSPVRVQPSNRNPKSSKPKKATPLEVAHRVGRA